MLTAWGERGDAAKMWEIGFSGYLTKPVKESRLYDCLTTVLGYESLNKGNEKGPQIVTRYTLAEVKKNVRILLAEDNLVNQKLAMVMLGKAGYKVTAVPNGRLAVEAVVAAPDDFDTILMDIQMPEMDGYEATRQLRQRGFANIPIIAMTANAMKGDKELCLEAGMNDYITKPIKREVVFQILERWLQLNT